jgi:predicted negative regulator of RcsB-dependent stress response
MNDFALYLATALAAVAAVAILTIGGLAGWRGWLELQRQALDQGRAGPATNAGSRIELADLRERVRKLESIAAGVDL